MTRHERYERLVDAGVIGVIRGADTEAVVDIALALETGGMGAVEVTADTSGAMEMIEAVVDALADEDVLVGAGTVLDSETARSALLAGAEFVVAPSVDPGTIECCNRYGAPVAPGAATPTEVVDAYAAGADLVKVFPASALGVDYLRSLRGPLGHVPLMPTGGVTLENVADFIKAGAVAVGVGSALVDQEAVESGDFDVLTRRAEQFVGAVADAR